MLDRSTRSTALAWLLGTALLAPCRALADDTVLRRELDATRAELARTQDELAATRSALADLTRRVDEIAATPAVSEAPPGVSAAAGQTARLAPVNANNPAISFVVDAQGASDTRDGDGAGFSLASGELFISAPIDPFLRGYASINGSSEEGFDIEEAALVTTALPGNFTVKAGRFFADVGRLSKWHDEALPFVDRPPSLERLIGGESGAEGMEVSWLAPTDHFIQLTTGVYNSVGSERREEGGGFFGKRSFSELSYLARPHTYFDLASTANLELGGTFLAVPQRHRRRLWGIDATFRHQPGTSDLYQGLTLGGEWLWNHEQFEDIDLVVDENGDPVLDDDGNEVFGPGRKSRTGGYGYAEAFFARSWSGGVRFDYSEALDDAIDRERTYSAFVTWMPSEFHRLRAQVDQIVSAGRDDQRFTLQWTAFLGSHRHGFATR